MKVPKLIKSVRYSLAAINGLFLLTGLILLLTGVSVLVIFNQYSTLITTKFFTLPSFTIATGVIIFLVGVLGFYGAISEHFYFIAGYVALLIVVLIFEIVITVMGFGLQNDAAKEIRTPMVQSLQSYETRLETAVIWDNLQRGFQCCGAEGIADWQEKIIGLPISCCNIEFGVVSPFVCDLRHAHEQGCATVLGEWLGYATFSVGVVAACVVSLQVLITATAGWVAYRAKFNPHD